MKIIDRYLLREFMKPVIFCMSAFSMMFVVFDIFDRLTKFRDAGTSVYAIAYYYVCFLAQVHEQIIPSSLLLATLYTLWRLGRHNELTAMRACGLGFVRLVRPFLAVGLFFTFATAALKEFFVPHASQWLAEFKDSDFQSPAQASHTALMYYNSEARRQWVIGRIDVKRPENIYEVRISEERADRSRLRDLYAERGECLDGEWWLFNVEVQEFSKQGGPKSSRVVMEHSDLGVAMPELTESPQDFANEVKDRFFFSARDILRYIAAHPSIGASEVRRLRAEFHGRLAAPWACLIVILFGIPAGAEGHRQSAFAATIVGVLLLISFYALTQIGLLLGKTSELPVWLGPWLANVVFLIAGVTMVGRMR